jgi:hypothetical protein
MNLPDAVLIGWSGMAVVWWLLAVGLIAAGRQRRDPLPEPNGPQPFLTVFKALPPISSDAHRAGLASALETFVAQLDANAEMLLGLPSDQEALWRPVLTDWARRFPNAGIVVRVLPRPRQRSNPKIAWLEQLAPACCGAEGEVKERYPVFYWR